jgi:chromosome segregation ATPase
MRILESKRKELASKLNAISQQNENLKGKLVDDEQRLSEVTDQFFMKKKRPSESRVEFSSPETKIKQKQKLLEELYEEIQHNRERSDQLVS